MADAIDTGIYPHPLGGSQQSSQLAPSSAPPPQPQPYIPPAIIFRAGLEAVAATCYGAPGKAEIVDCIVVNS